MGLLHIFSRGGDEAKVFEDAIYEIKDAIEDICDIYEDMKSEFSERGETVSRVYSSRGGYSKRDEGGYGERRHRR